MKRDSKKTRQPTISDSHKIARYIEEMSQLQGRLAQVEDHYRQRVNYLEHRLEEQHRILLDIFNSRGWRIWMGLTLPLRLFRKLKPSLKTLLFRPWRLPAVLGEAWRSLHREALGEKGLEALFKGRFNPIDSEYQAWIGRFETLSEEQQQQFSDLIGDVAHAPRITLVLLLQEEHPQEVQASLKSILDQDYPYWELWLVGSSESIDTLKKELPKGYNIQLIPVLPDQVTVGFQHVLEQTKGAYLGLIHQGDQLAPQALCFMAREIKENRSAVLIYSDEDRITEQGYRHDHYFKPEYNPDLLLGQDYLSRLSLFNCEKARQQGGFREVNAQAAFYDLTLRLCEQAELAQIRHIERVLYHTGTQSEDHILASVPGRIKAVRDHLTRQGYSVEVKASPLLEGAVRVRYRLPDPAPQVSIIIPTRNGLELLRQCIESIREKTDYNGYEILIVDNKSDQDETLRYLEALNKETDVRVLPYPHEFNFSAINNFAAKEAAGEVVVFLNNDMEVIAPSWLQEMVSLAMRKHTGAVGARLWYPDDRLQHAGVVIGIRKLAGHVMKFLPKGMPGYRGRALLVQNYSALTAACLAVRKEVFESIGGFDEVSLAVAFNDIDLCLRLFEAGYWNVWTPYAEFYHHESATRGSEDTQEKQIRFQTEVHYMLYRWERILRHDPAYNRNLTRVTEDFQLGWSEDID
jgi:GT2 family glycosyltransferase